MTNRTQNILIFLAMAVSIGLIVTWFYVLNKGDLVINTGLENYKIYIDDRETACAKDPCTLRLKIGTYEVRFEKEGYIAITSPVTIERSKTGTLKLDVKKKMEIKPSTFIPTGNKKALPAPNDLDSENIISYLWNAKSDRFLFLDKTDNRLKIREADGKTTLITLLKNIASPIDFYWSPDEKYILANQKADLYFIEISTGSRQKQVLDFIPSGIIWSPAGDFIMLNGENRSVYKIGMENIKTVQKINAELNLQKSVWIGNTTLLTCETDTEKNQTEIWSFDIANLIKEALAKKFDFPIGEIIYDSSQNTVYLRHERQGTWFEMKM